jgi:hypothetical protein
VVLSVDVFLFLTTTVAFGSTAPLESVTVPWMVAVDWPNAEEVAKRAATSIKKIAILLLSMLPPENVRAVVGRKKTSLSNESAVVID